MTVSYRRIISIAVCIICVVIALAFLIFNTREHQLTEYLPQQTKLAVVYSLGESSTVGAVWQAWQDQWREQTKIWVEMSGLPIRDISWSLDSTGQELIVMHSDKVISESQKKKLNDTSWPTLPLTQRRPHITIMDQKWIIVSEETYQLPKNSLTKQAPLLQETGWRLYIDNAEALDLVQPWLPESSFTLLRKKMVYPAQIVWKKNNDINQLHVISPSIVQTNTKPLYIPASADLYLDADPQIITLLEAYPEMNNFLSHLLPLKSGVSLESLKQLQKPWALALENSHWWLVGEREEVHSIMTGVSSLFSYKQRVSKLPDGTPFREIIRQSPPATTSDWHGLSLQSWKLADQNLYYWEHGSSTVSYLFDSTEFIPEQSASLAKSDFLNRCAGSDHQVSGIFWIKTDHFPDIIEKSEGSYQEIAVVTTSGSSDSGFFLCFR